MIKNKNSLPDCSKWKLWWVEIVAVVYFFITLFISLEIAKIIVSDEWLQAIHKEQIDGVFLSIRNIINVVLFYFLLPILLINPKNIQKIKQYIGLKAVSIKTVCLWLAGFFLLIMLTNAISYFMEKPIVPEYVVQMFQTIKSTPWLIIGIVIAPPIYEELIFRGFLYSGLVSRGWNVWLVIFLIALFFAALHFQYECYINTYMFFQMVLIGIARHISGSVILAIIIHSFISFVALAQVLIFGGF